MATASKRIGKYQLRSVIISTDYSTVHYGYDPDLEVEVALKVFDPKGKAADPGAKEGVAHWRERFVREARLLARLDHPHIIAVKELSLGGKGRPFFVMPFIEANLIYELGRDVSDKDAIASLPEAERPRRLVPARAIGLLRQLLSALSSLHRRGLVHRDVKPGNLLLTRKRGGDLKLTDFGMVKYKDWSISRAGTWLGTLDYIAPEQRENAKAVDARADVYSAGAVAYRMLAGRLPVGKFASLMELEPGLPKALDELLMAALAPQKQDRPADAGEMLAKLDAALRSPAAPQRRVARLVSISRNPESERGQK